MVSNKYVRGEGHFMFVSIGEVPGFSKGAPPMIRCKQCFDIPSRIMVWMAVFDELLSEMERKMVSVLTFEVCRWTEQVFFFKIIVIF
jgi:hypothetical protein